MKLAAFWENVKQLLYLNNSNQHRPFLLSVLCVRTQASQTHCETTEFKQADVYTLT